MIWLTSSSIETRELGNELSHVMEVCVLNLMSTNWQSVLKKNGNQVFSCQPSIYKSVPVRKTWSCKCWPASHVQRSWPGTLWICRLNHPRAEKQPCKGTQTSTAANIISVANSIILKFCEYAGLIMQGPKITVILKRKKSRTSGIKFICWLNNMPCHKIVFLCMTNDRTMDI